MRQHLFIAFAGAIALAATGCSSEPETTASSPAPSPVAVAPAPTPTATFAKPLVAQKPPTPGTIPGLTPSTNATQRAQQVQASINAAKGGNPFADLPPTIATPAVRPRPTRVPTVSQLPRGARPNGRTPLTPTNTSPRSNPLPPNGTPRSTPTNSPAGTPNNTANAPGSSTPTPSIAQLPPLPTATIAPSVEVTGVVRVGGTVQAIVKAPNESTSRYVGVGQRLSGGQVLVKRIEMNAGSDPVVVLEENGIEVAKAVGEKPASQQQRPA